MRTTHSLELSLNCITSLRLSTAMFPRTIQKGASASTHLARPSEHRPGLSAGPPVWSLEMVLQGIRDQLDIPTASKMKMVDVRRQKGQSATRTLIRKLASLTVLCTSTGTCGFKTHALLLVMAAASSIWLKYEITSSELMLANREDPLRTIIIALHAAKILLTTHLSTVTLAVMYQNQEVILLFHGPGYISKCTLTLPLYHHLVSFCACL